MSLGREIKDFIQAFQAGSQIAMQSRRLALSEQQLKDTKAYRDATLKLSQDKFDHQVKASDRAFEYRQGRDAVADKRFSTTQGFRERQHSDNMGLRNRALGLQERRLDILQRGTFDPSSVTLPPPVGPQSALPTPDQERNLADSIDPTRPSEQPAQQQQSALPVVDSYDTSALDTQDDEDEEQTFRRGGMVRSYAAGGMVDDEEDGYSDEEDAADLDYGDDGMGDEEDLGDDVGGPVQVASALPVTGQGNQPAPPSSAGGTNKVTDFPAGMALHGAITVVQNNIKRQGAEQPRALPTNEPAQRPQRAYRIGIPAATDQEYDEIARFVDPENRLDSAVKELAVLKAGYDFYLRQGNPAKAEGYAAGIVRRAEEASMRLGAGAEQAIRRGDWKNGVEMLRRAYDNIPDGQSAMADIDDNGNGMLTLRDQNGAVISRNPFSPKDLLAAATGMKDGTLFWRSITDAASRNLGRPPSPTKAYNAAMEALGRGVIPDTALSASMRPSERNEIRVRSNKLADDKRRLAHEQAMQDRADLRTSRTSDNAALSRRKTDLEMLDGAWEEYATRVAGDKGDPAAMLKQLSPTIRNSAYEVFSANRVAPGAAIDAVMALTYVDPKDPSKTNFKASFNPEQGMAMVRFDNGLSVRVPGSAFEQLLNARTERAAKARKELSDASDREHERFQLGQEKERLDGEMRERGLRRVEDQNNWIRPDPFRRPAGLTPRMDPDDPLTRSAIPILRR